MNETLIWKGGPQLLPKVGLMYDGREFEYPVDKSELLITSGRAERKKSAAKQSKED